MEIVILSFNLPDLTGKCVSSALAHSSPEKIHLIHNGSSEKNFQLLKSRFPEINHVFLKENRHFSGGANEGLRNGFKKSEWVLFLTNDCELIQLSSPPAQPGLYAPEIHARKWGKIDSLGGRLDSRKMKLSHCKTSFEFHQSQLKYVPGTAFWIHQDFFNALNGFDESYQTYWEDVDLSLRARGFEFPIGLNEDTKILHQIGKTCHKDMNYTTFLFQRNRRRIAKKFFSHSVLTRISLEIDFFRLMVRFLIKKDLQRLNLLMSARKNEIS